MMMALLKREYLLNKSISILIFFVLTSACQTKVNEYQKVDESEFIETDTLNIERIKIKTH